MNQKSITNQILTRELSLNSTLNYLFNISNMKKLFTYLLISSMVVLSSCTNYDDQFDDLNSQLSTLKSQIDGFSSLSSGLTALQGTVTSLQSAVAALPKTATPATDISGLQTALTALAATVAELKTSLASAATSAEVSALATSLASAQTDLAELLAANNVYSTDLVINSPATLAFAKSLGDKLTIVNANVTFDVDATMATADVQAVANKFVTIVKDLNYYATSSTVAAVTFDNLTSAGDVAIAQAGNYVFPKLANATDIYLGANYSSKVGIVDFRSLAKVTSLNTSTILAADIAGTTPATNTANTVSFSQATEIHLTAVPYYGASLTALGKAGSVIDLTAFASVDADGDEVNYALNITGPAALTLTKFTKGALIVTDVTTVSLSGHRGNVTLDGVANFTSDKLVGVLTLSSTNDLKSINVTGALDDDTTVAAASADKVYPDVVLSSQTALTSATFAGGFVIVNLTGASNLTSITNTAQISTLTLSGNNDLTSATIGGKINSLTVTGADDLLSLSLTHTTFTSTTAPILKSGSLVVTNNPKLESLTSVADLLSTLTVTGNANLATVNFTGLKAIGGDTMATVKIGGAGSANALNATKIVDTYNTTAAAAVEATNTGAFTSASGMSTLKTYLGAAAAAPSVTGVKVYFDTADLHITEGATSAANTEKNSLKIATSGDVAQLTVVNVTKSVSTTTGTTVRQRISNVWDLGRDAVYNNLALVANTGVSIAITNGITKTYVGTSEITTVSGLVDAINADTTSFGADVTVTAALDSYSQSYNKISYTDSDGTAATTNSTGTIYWSYGATTTGTAAIGTGSSTAQIATAIAAALSTTSDVYNASATGNVVLVTKLVTNTQNVDLGPGVSFANTLAITELGSNTVQWSTNTSNAAGQDSDYFLSTSKFDTKGLRVMVQNNSTSVVMAATVTGVAPGTNLSVVPALLASGTNMVGDFSYVAGFGDVDTASTSVAAGSTTNRSHWL
jgi:hypothetical protein